MTSKIADLELVVVNGLSYKATRVRVPGSARDLMWDISGASWNNRGWYGSVDEKKIFVTPGREVEYTGRRLADPDDEPNLSGLEAGGPDFASFEEAVTYVVEREG